MINSTGLEVQLKLDDQLTAGFNKSFNAIQQKIDGVSQSFVSLGREITQAGRNMTFLGAAITGPMAVAFKTASDYSIEASDSMRKLGSAAIDFQSTIGSAMLPVVQKVTSIIQYLNDWFKSLDETMRNNIISTALVAGLLLLLGGSILNVIGKVASLTGRLIEFMSANFGLVLIIGSLVAMIYYWDQVRIVVIPVLNALQIAVDWVAIGYEKLALGMAHVLAFSAALIGKQDLAVYFEGQAIAIENVISDLEKSMTGAMSGNGLGEWVDNGVQYSKQKLQDFMDFFNGQFIPQTNAAMQQFSQDFEKSFNQAYNNAINLGQQTAGILTSQINMVSAGVGKAVSDMILHGKNFGESMKAVFMDMASALITSVIQMLAQWVIYQAFQGVILAASIGMATAVASAWAGAAAMVSLATFGANSGPAMAAIAMVTGMAQGLAAIPKAEKGANILSGGSVLVGERGPEILNLPAGARVSPLGKSGGVTVYMENAYFGTPDEAEDTLARLSRLIDERSRSRIR